MTKSWNKDWRLLHAESDRKPVRYSFKNSEIRKRVSFHLTLAVLVSPRFQLYHLKNWVTCLPCSSMYNCVVATLKLDYLFAFLLWQARLSVRQRHMKPWRKCLDTVGPSVGCDVASWRPNRNQGLHQLRQLYPHRSPLKEIALDGN